MNTKIIAILIGLLLAYLAVFYFLIFPYFSKPAIEKTVFNHPLNANAQNDDTRRCVSEFVANNMEFYRCLPLLEYLLFDNRIEELRIEGQKQCGTLDHDL